MPLFGGPPDRDLLHVSVQDLYTTEMEYLTAIKGMEVLYSKPLEKLTSLSSSEHFALFKIILPVCQVSQQLCSEVCIGHTILHT